MTYSKSDRAHFQNKLENRSHISSLLSIALDLDNCYLLRDFVAIELHKTFKFDVDVSKMSMNILIIFL